MDKNTNLRGEAYWHVLLDEQCHIKDMINVQLPFPIEEKDWSIFYNLMNTDVINTEELELSNGKCYLFNQHISPFYQTHKISRSYKVYKISTSVYPKR